jgi:hypothetical protein
MRRIMSNLAIAATLTKGERPTHPQYDSLRYELYRTYVVDQNDGGSREWTVNVAWEICSIFWEIWPDNEKERQRSINQAVHRISWLARIRDHNALLEIPDEKALESKHHEISHRYDEQAKAQPTQRDSEGGRGSGISPDSKRTELQLALSLIFLQSAKFSFDHNRVRRGLEATNTMLGCGKNLDQYPVLTAFGYFRDFGSEAQAPEGSVARLEGQKNGDQSSARPAVKVKELRDFWTENLKSWSGEQPGAADQPDGIVLQIVLHSIWLTPLSLLQEDGFSELRAFLIEKASQLSQLKSEKQVALYRLAYGYRADRKYVKALETMDEVLQSASQGDAALFEQFLTVRDAIQQEMQWDEITETLVSQRVNEEVTKSLTDFENRVEVISVTARNQIDGSLVRVVEILGIFVALIAVVATAIGALQLPNLDGWERVGVITLGLTLPLGFVYALRLVVRSSGD